YAITKAMGETELGVDLFMAGKIAEEIYHISKERVEPLDIEEIQDLVEHSLMEKKRFDVAKRYIIYREERSKERSKKWDMSELQEDVYEQKYKFENESFGGFLDRVSGGNSEIRKLIQQRDFLFGGRILAGRGINRNVSLANCTTLPPVQDNIESIFDTAKELGRMFSYGQGAGIDISNLRARGAKVNNASKTSTGAVSFMEIFDVVGNVIGAEGRRSALLIAMDADHPDIMEFINVKNDLNKVNNANISVKVNDDFMKQDTPKKREILREIAKSSHATGEPAILGWDNMKRWHLLSADEDYVIDGVNACSEYPTIGYGTCLLGSINLSNYVIEPFTENARIDIEKLSKDTMTIVIAMNEVLDEAIPTHPLPMQREVSADYRQIGIGIMSLADMFIKLGIEYGDKESLEVVNIVMGTIRDNAFIQSIELSKVDGSFPKFNFDKMSKSSYFQSLPKLIQEGIKEYGIRNSSLLSIAPAGTISLLVDGSNGLEPLFANSYTRTTKSLGAVDKEYKVYAGVIKELMEFKGIKDEWDLPSYCVTSRDIRPKNRID
ncbi:MAG TPA: ATP cone domain-containing protein, partial [Tissierellaceae bacterium]|nr:ATP cone domain-containing protein [Tissierellaceae bacterium]